MDNHLPRCTVPKGGMNQNEDRQYFEECVSGAIYAQWKSDWSHGVEDLATVSPTNLNDPNH